MSTESWFDNECEEPKNSIKRKCRKPRQNPRDMDLNICTLKDNKLLKKLIKRKKEDYKLGK